MHLSESCEEELPQLLTHVETTSVPFTDANATPIIHHKLAVKQLLPAEHIVDNGYLDSELIVETEHTYQGLKLIGPAKLDNRS